MRRLSHLGKNYFDVRWMGEPVDNFRVKTTPASSTSGYFGINWIELRRAARYSEYTWDEFCGLSAVDRIGVLVFYRLENRVSALISDWQAKEMEAKSAGRSAAAKAKGKR